MFGGVVLVMHPAWDGGFSRVRLGRLSSRHDPRLLRLAKYIDLAELPSVPPAWDLTGEVLSWPMYDNDRLGDCTCAAVGHMVQAWTAAHGSVLTPDPGLVDRMYWRTGIPAADTGTAGGPTDTGRVETDVLGYWRDPGLGGVPDRSAPITAYAAVDAKNLDHVRAAIYLFGGVYTGIGLPRSAQWQHTVWDVADPTLQGNAAFGSWGGHAVPYLGYDRDTFTCVTWGGLMKLTDAFHMAYTDEVYAIISPDWVGGGTAPSGLNMEGLLADLAAVTA